ncbi:MAG: hypothetical protein ACREIJ_03560 [Nitrospiraceae bacterium]
MNSAEARAILLAESARYRAKSYKDLVYLLEHQDCYEVEGLSGARYQLEIQAFWDDKPNDVLASGQASMIKAFGLSSLWWKTFSLPQTGALSVNEKPDKKVS